ncbi:MAG: histidine--tRNA ligase [Oscillatoriales cyanobacterium SM2_1_8]|nr:histidine--tRNA ligase [Oscillatoriales cyanobacterium SM2_1_8]
MEERKALRGTRDLFGTEIALWQKIEAIAQAHLTRARFTEVRTPILEATELFARGIGEATDIVGKEMYSFVDRGDRPVTLRPEGTAGVVRAAIEHKWCGPGVVQKLWYRGAMFRYERPQAGRQRQFHQLGIEVLGSDDPRADAEAIALAYDLLQALGLSELVVDVNSVGTPADRQTYRQALVDYFGAHQDLFDDEARDRLARNPLRLLDSKDPQMAALAAAAPNILEYLGAESQAHFAQVQAYLTALAVPYRLNPRLVRGLDYYTRTAFEIQSNALGAQSAVCGGGRYDNLIGELGGPPTPAIGWAMGLERLVLLLGEPPAPPPLHAYIVARGSLAAPFSLKVAQTLRAAGLTVDLDLTQAKLDKQLKRAAASGALAAIVLGDDEAQREVLQLKWLQTGDRQEVTLAASIPLLHGAP